jgi:membrane associated rhomboid family serine protease
MDAKKTLATWPLSGSLFLIVLCGVFYLGYTQDQTQQAAIYSYHTTHLLKTETPLFEDFYRKRLAIEQTGSDTLLNSFRQARQADQFDILSRIIISDRSFRPYLHDNTHILFTAQEAERWRGHSSFLSEKIQQLRSTQFALIPERFHTEPQFSRLLSYLFIDHQLVNLLSNVLILLGFFILMEARLRRLRFWTAAFALSLLHGCSYLLVADQLSMPLSGVTILVYYCMSLAIFMTVQLYRQQKSKARLYTMLTLSLVSLLKFFFDAYVLQSFPEQLPGILLAVIFAAMLVWKNIVPKTEDDDVAAEPLPAIIQPDLNPTQRKEFQEALTALGRFNFAYARDKLRSLHAEIPDAVRVQESLYHLEKLQPADRTFWCLFETRLAEILRQGNYCALLTLLDDLQQVADFHEQADYTIIPEYYLQVMRICLQHNHLDKSELVFSFLQKAADSNKRKAACQLLIDYAIDRKLAAKQTHYQAVYTEL